MPGHRKTIRPVPPGSLYAKDGKYYWSGRLPGETGRARSRAVKPDGQTYAIRATPDNEPLARQIVWNWIDAAATPIDSTPPPGTITVGDLRARYLAHARVYYRRADGTPTGQADNVEWATRLLVSRHGSAPAASFGRAELQALRQELIRANLAITTVNKYCDTIKRLYRWAAGEAGLLGSEAYYGLAVVTNLRRSRTTARQTDPIQPADERAVDATLAHLPLTLWRMVMVQRLTGMRTTEVCILRPADIDRTGAIWLYRPAFHKSQHLGREKIIPLGPLVRALLAPQLNRPPKAYLFTPTEAQAERYDTRRLIATIRRPADHLTGPAHNLAPRYDRRSYYVALHRALAAAQAIDPTIPHWHPHQLRHSFLTRVGHAHGAEAARAAAGHTSLDTTEIYLARDTAAASQIAADLG